MAQALPIIMLASSAYSAYGQQQAGKQQASSLAYQGEFNAEVYEQQAQMVLEKKKLQDYQSSRSIGKAQGAVIAHTAGSGFTFSGSPLAIAIDNETQMRLDQAVGDYNSDVERNFALSGATYSRHQAKENANLAKSTGNSNAFSTILSSTSNIFASRAGKL